MNEVMQIESAICATPSISHSPATAEDTPTSPAGPMVFTVTPSSNSSQGAAPVLKLVSPVEGGAPQLIKVVPAVVSASTDSTGQSISTDGKVMVQKVDDGQSDGTGVLAQRVYSIVSSTQKIPQIQGNISANVNNQTGVPGMKSPYNNGQQRIHTLSSNARLMTTSTATVSTAQKVQILSNVVVNKQNIVINKNPIQAPRQIITTVPQKQLNNNIQKPTVQSHSTSKLQTVNNVVITTNQQKTLKNTNIARPTVQTPQKTIKTLSPQSPQSAYAQKSTGIKTLSPQMNHYNKILQNQVNKVQPRVGIKTLTPQRPAVNNNNNRMNNIPVKPNYIGKHAGQAQKSQSKANLAGNKNRNLSQQRMNAALSPAKYNNQKSGVGNASSNFNQSLTAQILQSLPSAGGRNNAELGFSPTKHYPLQSPPDDSSLSEDIGEEVKPDFSPNLSYLYQVVMLDHNYGAPPPELSPPSIISRTSTQHQSTGSGGAALNGTIVSGRDRDRESNIGTPSGYYSAPSTNKRGNTRINSTVPPHKLPTNTHQNIETRNNISNVNPTTTRDDDAASTVSSERDHAEDVDEGEETETAPEGEGDEDGITRCICDFDHDDGYMICCDICSSWQHVDCMGLDRDHIPDKYSCVRCQPRHVDRQHARAIQQRKREEFARIGVVMNSSTVSGAVGAGSGSGNASDTSSDTSTADSTDGHHQQGGRHSLNNNLVGVGSKKRTPVSLATRRKSEPASAPGRRAPLAHKRQQRRESARETSLNTAASRRQTALKKREKKQIIKRKMKSRSSIDDSSQDSWPSSTYTNSMGASLLQLRQWIENYEEAVTNHYSPELRARITNMRANGAHQENQLQDKQAPPTAQADVTVQKCRVSGQPLTGIKIVLATQSLTANSPVIELRGKYMLSTQHRSSLGNSGNNAGGLLTRQHSQRPGPFLFFYRLPRDGTEVCVDTRTYGNDARFIRRSCRPNAELRHLVEKGTLHLYVIATTAIDKNSELTIRHESHDQAAVAAASSPGAVIVPCACGGGPNTCGLYASHRKNGEQEALARDNAEINTTTHRKRRGRRASSPSRTDSTPPHNTPLTSPTTSHQSNTQHSNSQASADIKTPTDTSVTPAPPALSTRRASAHQTRATIREKSNERDKDKEEIVRTDPKDKKKKLTREERKMEAIMKAFERLEKAEQRKQEVQARQAQRRENDPPIPVVPHSSSNTTKQDNTDAEREIVRTRRKKRKGRARTVSTTSQSSTRRRTRLNSTDSYMTSGDESSLLSPPLPQTTPPVEHAPEQRHTRSMTQEQNSSKIEQLTEECLSPGNNKLLSVSGSQASDMSSPGQVNTAAGLLLALANGGNLNSEHQTLNKSPENDGNSSGSNCSLQSSPGTPLSSACLLVAAAVGPLEPGFKFPKTKKAIMNEWLNKSPEPVQSSSISVDIPQEIPSAPSINPPQSLEFYPNNATANKSLATLVQAASLCDSPPQSFPGKNAGGNAKKRWLRQAISEECDSPRPDSPPTSEMVAPPKKRRLARESISSEQSFTPPTTPTMLVPPSNSLADEDFPNNDEEFYEENQDDSNKINRVVDVVLSGSSGATSCGFHPELESEGGSIKEQLEFVVGGNNKREEENLGALAPSLMDPRLGRTAAPVFSDSAQLLGTVEKSIRFYEESLTGSITPSPSQVQPLIEPSEPQPSTEPITQPVVEVQQQLVEEILPPPPVAISPPVTLKESKKLEMVTPAKRKLSISEYRQRKQLKVPSTGATTPERAASPETPPLSVTPTNISNVLTSTATALLGSGTGGKLRPRSRSASTSSTTSTLSSDEELAIGVGLELGGVESNKIASVVEPQVAVAFNSAPTAVERQRENVERLKKAFGLSLDDDTKRNTTITKDINMSPKSSLISSELSKSEPINSKFILGLDSNFPKRINSGKSTVTVTSTSPVPVTEENDTEDQETEKKDDDFSKFEDTVTTSFIPPFNNPVYPNSAQFTSFSSVIDSSAYEGRNPSPPPAELLKSTQISSYPNSTSLPMSPSAYK